MDTINSTEEFELTVLRPLAKEFPNIDAAVAEIARLSAILTLPKGTIHVISDIHGEDQKLRHIINNASGTLRPLLEKLFAATMTPGEFEEFLTLTFYPAEVTAQLETTLTDPARLREFAIRTLRHQFTLVRTLAARYSLKRAMQVFPREYSDLLAEMVSEPTTERNHGFIEAIVAELQRRGTVLHLIHIVGRVVRNLAIYELIIGGDCWDRGPRGDRVMDYLKQQPNVSFIWGNHDAAWLGACLGHEALIAHVLRISLRYRRLGQLDEGYSIPLLPLEHLARTVYADDPAAQFLPKEQGMRPDLLVARMQKAAAIMQFKLEGQMIARNPQWGMEQRRVLRQIDFAKGTIRLEGREYALRDKLFPTIDPANPEALTSEEMACMEHHRRCFMGSQKLWQHCQYMVMNGAMYLVRDDHLIFHGCVAVSAEGEFLPMEIDGEKLTGRPLFHAIERVVRRAMEQRRTEDMDLLWYLWSGALSPLFGKDKIATFERDFILDKETFEEHKNPYFSLINEGWFCEKVLREFGVDAERGLIVNGHVPVKIEAGENPLKRSGKAITIDGAFSEAYGDHGFTLVLEAQRTILALHHHFESVQAAIKNQFDIIPSVTVVREWPEPRLMADTEKGEEFRCEIRMLEKLIEAYRGNRLRPEVAE